ncbi:hypothetical protein AK51_11445 [Serratia nematodiphila DZ0503SBS1]|nr:hypothetical protein AK51_11445 [Serratia nematodiphila DZ0503SBS1]
MTHRLANRLLQRRSIGAVGLDGEGFAAGGGNGARHRFGAIGRGGVGKGDGGALARQAFNDGGADAAGAALNECDFALQWECCGHVISPEWMRVKCRHSVSEIACTATSHKEL